MAEKIATQQLSREVIYLVGPYRAPSEFSVLSNIKYAESCAAVLWKAGYIVICPHKNTAFFGGLCPDKVWIDAGKELIKRSDLVVTILGWQDSEGSKEEVEFAREIGKPVLTVEQVLKRST